MDPRDRVRMMPHYKPHDYVETEPRIVLMTEMFRLALNEVQKSVIQEFSAKLSEEFLLWNFVPLWLSEKDQMGLKDKRVDIEHLRRLLEELSHPTAVSSISRYLYNDGRYDEAKAFKFIIESAFEVVDKIKVELRPKDLHLSCLKKVRIERPGQRKKFILFRRDGQDWKQGAPSCEIVPYRYQDWRDDKGPLFLGEGEKVT